MPATAAAPNAPTAEDPLINAYLRVGNYTEAVIMLVSQPEAYRVRAAVDESGHLEEHRIPGEDRVLLIYSGSMANWSAISDIAIVWILPHNHLLRRVIRAMHRAPVAMALVICALLASSTFGTSLFWVVLAWNIDCTLLFPFLIWCAVC
jgi:hypothetical protein